MHKDTIVGIVGAAILVAAMAGVFWYEGTRGATSEGARSFSIAFAPDEVNGPGDSGTATVGAPVEKTLKIATGNLTKVRFTLVWTDEANTGPDSFTLKVQGPDGTGAAKEASGANQGTAPGEVVVEFTLGELPVSTSVLANSAEEAEDRAMSQNARMLGVGDWKITVTLTEAGDAIPFAPPGGLPVNPVDDNSNAWELKSILTVFAASAE